MERVYSYNHGARTGVEFIHNKQMNSRTYGHSLRFNGHFPGEPGFRLVVDSSYWVYTHKSTTPVYLTICNSDIIAYINNHHDFH